MTDIHETFIINNAVTYICLAYKDGNQQLANELARTLYERAYRKGYEDGYRDGKKEGRVKVKTVYKTVKPDEDWGEFKG